MALGAGSEVGAFGSLDPQGFGEDRDLAKNGIWLIPSPTLRQEAPGLRSGRGRPSPDRFHPKHGVSGEFRSGFEIELAFDTAAVCLNGFDTHAKASRNLFGFFGLPD